MLLFFIATTTIGIYRLFFFHSVCLQFLLYSVSSLIERDDPWSTQGTTNPLFSSAIPRPYRGTLAESHCAIRANQLELPLNDGLNAPMRCNVQELYDPMKESSLTKQ